MKTTELRIPIGGRQTSWLLTRINQARTQNNISLCPEQDLNPGHRIEIQQPKPLGHPTSTPHKACLSLMRLNTILFPFGGFCTWQLYLVVLFDSCIGQLYLAVVRLTGEIYSASSIWLNSFENPYWRRILLVRQHSVTWIDSPNLFRHPKKEKNHVINWKSLITRQSQTRSHKGCVLCINFTKTFLLCFQFLKTYGFRRILITKSRSLGKPRERERKKKAN